MTSVYRIETAAPSESRTETVKPNDPFRRGTPVITPVAEFSLSPTGNLPDAMLQVGSLPPATVTFAR